MNRHAMTIFVLTVVAVSIACSKAPRQYRNPVAPPASTDPSTLGGEKVLPPPTQPAAGLARGERGEETQEEIDRRVRENSLKPIKLGEGAAGISLTTTYEDSEFKLSKGRLVSNGCTYYREGVCIFWRNDKPRLPTAILVTNGYLGNLALPAPYGTVKIGQELSAFFSTGPVPQDPKAQAFIEAIYRQVKNVGEDVHCLADETCFIKWSPEGSSFSFEMPGVVLAFGNNSRRVLGGVLIIASSEPAGLEGRVELLKGEIQILDDKEQVTDRVALGETWGEVVRKSGLEDDQRYSVSTRNFGKSLRGLGLSILRDKFGKDDRRPEADDQVVAVAFDEEFRGQFRMNNKKLVIRQSGNDVKVELAEQAESGPETIIFGEERKVFPNQAAKQITFLRGLIQLTESEMRKVIGPDEVVVSSLEGLHQNSQGRTFSGEVIRYNQKTRQGIGLSFSISEDSGLVSVGYGMFDSDFERTAFEEGLEPWVAGSKRLAGLELGRIFYLKDKDEDRRTATLRYQHPQKGWMELRVGYNPNGEQPVMYREGNETKTFYQPIYLVSVGTVASLGAQALGATQLDGQSYEAYEITVIASDDLYKSIKGLCEIEDFELPIGAYDLDVLGSASTGSVKESIPVAIRRAEAAVKSAGGGDRPACLMESPVDQTAQGRSSKIFFPDQRTMINFSDRELSGAVIYKKPDPQARERLQRGGGQ
ncbi:MAG: hypothetical protein IT288_18160 [Bdellovibrionales bacterium]|nr:hypothetical protein [Bdellovibrionales bacterium]